MTYHMAIDIGASSGRHILGSIQDGKMVLEEVYRFPNKQIIVDNFHCWDIEYLVEEILEGLKVCKTLGKIPSTVAIDTWAVDFVLLDKEYNLLGNAVSYRDNRTQNIDFELEKLIDFPTLYQRTGIQKQIFNTIYQLFYLSQHQADTIKKAEYFLMLPDYFAFVLTGQLSNEFTNATSTSLINAESKTWDKELLELIGIPEKLFKTPVEPGTSLGPLRPEITDIIGYSSEFIVAASHDTASAFLAAPKQSQYSVILSSGTWSLIGTEIENVNVNLNAQKFNFTNEGGYKQSYRFLKNIMGLWMIQSIRRELNGENYLEGTDPTKSNILHTFSKGNKKFSFANLIQAAQNSEFDPIILDVDDAIFLAPNSMINAVFKYAERNNLPLKKDLAHVVDSIYHSLSHAYNTSIQALENTLDIEVDAIHIVGGGSQDSYLNELTRKICKKKVFAGPIEATSIGNIVIQLIAKEKIKNINEARELIKYSFAIEEV